MNTSFTPGPWADIPQNGAGPMIAHKFETGNQINPTGLRLICHMLQRGNSLEQDEANARLIAAAPELYAALVAILDAAKTDRGDAFETGFRTDQLQKPLIAARAAIAKVQA